MEYRFSVTARLITVGVFGLVALMVLLFALGVAVGNRLASAKPHTLPAAATEIVPEAAPTPAPAVEGADK